MIHVLIIAACASLYIHDARIETQLITRGLPPIATLTLWIGVCVAAWCCVQAAAVLGRLRMDSRGTLHAALRAERLAGLSRLLGTLWFIACVLALGLPDAMRAIIGDWVLLDEAALLLGFVVFLAATWWSTAPITRRMREARIIRQLDEGSAIYPIPTRIGLVMLQVRAQILIILLPVLAIMGTSEGIYWLADFGPAPIARHLADPATRSLVVLAGSLIIFALAPLVVRIAWQTVRLGEGELRDKLKRMCERHRVRAREFLVWRTAGQIPNAAVIGFVAPLRYIVLSDALLDRLTESQVEAVAAHELAHIKRHHMPWLAAAMIAIVLLIGTPAGWLVEWTIGPDGPDGWIGSLAIGLTLAVALVGFGFVSRRFEWQADAFAAQHLSGLGQRPDAVITPEATTAMVGALATVAATAGVLPEQRSWRHGSIAQRCRKLLALTGKPVGSLVIDRRVRRLKLVIALALLAGAGLVAIDVQRLSGPDRASQPVATPRTGP